MSSLASLPTSDAAAAAALGRTVIAVGCITSSTFPTCGSRDAYWKVGLSDGATEVTAMIFAKPTWPFAEAAGACLGDITVVRGQMQIHDGRPQLSCSSNSGRWCVVPQRVMMGSPSADVAVGQLSRWLQDHAIGILTIIPRIAGADAAATAWALATTVLTVRHRYVQALQDAAVASALSAERAGPAGHPLRLGYGHLLEDHIAAAASCFAACTAQADDVLVRVISVQCEDSFAGSGAGAGAGAGAGSGTGRGGAPAASSSPFTRWRLWTWDESLPPYPVTVDTSPRSAAYSSSSFAAAYSPASAAGRVEMVAVPCVPVIVETGGPLHAAIEATVRRLAAAVDARRRAASSGGAGAGAAGSSGAADAGSDPSVPPGIWVRLRNMVRNQRPFSSGMGSPSLDGRQIAPSCGRWRFVAACPSGTCTLLFQQKAGRSGLLAVPDDYLQPELMGRLLPPAVTEASLASALGSSASSSSSSSAAGAGAGGSGVTAVRSTVPGSAFIRGFAHLAAATSPAAVGTAGARSAAAYAAETQLASAVPQPAMAVDHHHDDDNAVDDRHFHDDIREAQASGGVTSPGGIGGDTAAAQAAEIESSDARKIYVHPLFAASVAAVAAAAAAADLSSLHLVAAPDPEAVKLLAEDRLLPSAWLDRIPVSRIADVQRALLSTTAAAFDDVDVVADAGSAAGGSVRSDAAGASGPGIQVVRLRVTVQDRHPLDEADWAVPTRLLPHLQLPTAGKGVTDTALDGRANRSSRIAASAANGMDSDGSSDDEGDEDERAPARPGKQSDHGAGVAPAAAAVDETDGWAFSFTLGVQDAPVGFHPDESGKHSDDASSGGSITSVGIPADVELPGRLGRKARANVKPQATLIIEGSEAARLLSGCGAKPCDLLALDNAAMRHRVAAFARAIMAPGAVLDVLAVPLPALHAPAIDTDDRAAIDETDHDDDVEERPLLHLIATRLLPSAAAAITADAAAPGESR